MYAVTYSGYAVTESETKHFVLANALKLFVTALYQSMAPSQ